MGEGKEGRGEIQWSICHKQNMQRVGSELHAASICAGEFGQCI